MARWPPLWLSGLFLLYLGILEFCLIMLVFRMHARGARVTGVAVRTWSKESTDTDSDGNKSTSTSYYTEVGYVVGADRHVVTVTGKYAVGQGVPMVYDPDYPDVALSESDLGELVGCVWVIPVVIGLVVFWLISSR